MNGYSLGSVRALGEGSCGVGSQKSVVFVAALARQRALMSDYRPLLDLLFNQSRQSFIACLTKKWWRLLL